MCPACHPQLHFSSQQAALVPPGRIGRWLSGRGRFGARCCSALPPPAPTRTAEAHLFVRLGCFALRTLVKPEVGRKQIQHVSAYSGVDELPGGSSQRIYVCWQCGKQSADRGGRGCKPTNLLALISQLRRFMPRAAAKSEGGVAVPRQVEGWHRRNILARCQPAGRQLQPARSTRGWKR